MTEETKKISFGFSKLKKTSNLVKNVDISKPEVEYVDSFDGVKGKFSYKGNVRSDEVVKKELVIPLIGTKSAFDVIKSRLKLINADKQDGDKRNEKQCSTSTGPDTGIGEDVIVERDKKKHLLNNEEVKDVKQELSIDELAAKEIISDLQNNGLDEKSSNAMVIRQSNKSNKTAEEAYIDYENIPVTDFGLAMLRGMGWTPETGIGKDQRIVQVIAPKLRPKGLGLGADKVVLEKPAQDPDLTISIKGYVKFVNGPHKGNYGVVEALDESNGRVIVRLALGGTVSASEVLMIPVTKKDYEKNSKVLSMWSFPVSTRKSNKQICSRFFESFADCTEFEHFKVKPKREPEPKDIRNHGAEVSEKKIKGDQSNAHRKEKYDRRNSRGRSSGSVSEDSESGSKKKKRRRYTSSSSSSSSSLSRSQRSKKKKGTRDDSRDRRYKKTKKKRKKKRRHSSEGDSYSSDDGRRKKDRSTRDRSHRPRNGSGR